MKAMSYLKGYLKIFLILASPFLFLTFANLFIPLNIDLTYYGYIFSFFASFLLILNLRQERILIYFNNRDLYINDLKNCLNNLGYTEESREGLLTTFQPQETNYPSRKVLAYIYKDSALILAPKKHIKALRNT